MDWIDKALEYSRALHPILQSVLGAAIFALLLWLGRILYQIVIKSFKELRLDYEIKKVTKIIIHQHYLNTNGLYYFSQGYFIVIYKAFLHLIKALILISIGIAVYFLFINEKFIFILTFYFGIQYLIEAYSWLNPNLLDDDLNNYDESIVKRTLEKLVYSPKRRLENQKENVIEDKNQVEDIKSQIDNLYNDLMGKSSNQKKGN
jgi:hypothetical protein